jgi:hypothetical protein
MIIMLLSLAQNKTMIELLDKKHKRNDFDCGKELLNNYLKYQAGQDIKRKLSACFVLADKETIAFKDTIHYQTIVFHLAVFQNQ